MTAVQHLTTREQLRAGRRPRRLLQLFFGLWLYGLSMALMLRGSLGVDPWDVFHTGLQAYLPLSFGQVVIVTSVVVLLLWIPLKQWPGLGTVANSIVIGLATDATLAWVSTPDALALQLLLLVAGVMLNGLAGALYIGAQFGPGPRDGLMTGLARRTGLSIRLVRTALEVAVLATGWLLGGQVGLGTVLYALAIGPLVQLFLPLCVVRVDVPGATDSEVDCGPGGELTEAWAEVSGEPR